VEQRKIVDDRQLDALLERLERLTEEVRGIRRRLDENDQQLRIARELAALTESIQALAYAALGSQAPSVRRRRTG
jgi:DNA-binding FrmR family transcriptional regulator